MYAAIAALVREEGGVVEAACASLGVSRSAYYAWCERAPSNHERREAELTPLIRVLFWKHGRRYGARRLVADLADLGHACSRRRVRTIMKKEGLRAIQPKSFVPKTTDSRHLLGYSPNLILDAPDPSGVDQLWVGDITYVPLQGGGFCYLAALMDRYSRDIVGWEIAETMTDELTLQALRMGIRERQPPALLVHHTDRGGQYASHPRPTHHGLPIFFAGD